MTVPPVRKTKRRRVRAGKSQLSYSGKWLPRKPKNRAVPGKIGVPSQAAPNPALHLTAYSLRSYVASASGGR